MTVYSFPRACCRCNRNPGSARLTVTGGVGGGAYVGFKTIDVPVCPACIDAMEADAKAMEPRWRRWAFRIAAVFFLVVGPLSVLPLVFFAESAGEAGQIAMLVGFAIALVVPLVTLAMVPSIPKQCRELVKIRTAQFAAGQGLVFGNREYQQAFDQLNLRR